MKTLSQHYIDYLETKKFLWSVSTLRSEKHRLTSLLASRDPLSLSDVSNVWSELVAQGLASYARLTAWVRLTSFFDYLLSNQIVSGENVYAKFRKDNAQLFRNAYTKKLPKIDFKEAVRRIKTITNIAVQIKCLQLLEHGMRFTESKTLKDGVVVGKGGKVRDLYTGETAVNCEVSYSTILRALRAVGINGTHELRKIRASHLVEHGASSFELKELMGWSSINTAESYVNIKTSRLKALSRK